MEKKSFGILVSQAAAGGAVSGFLLTAGEILLAPNLYNFLLFAYLPVILAIGGGVGIITGVLIWLFQIVLKRVPGFLARMAVSIISVATISAVWALVQKSLGFDARIQDSDGDWSLLYWFPIVGAFLGWALPISLIAGSRIRPWHLVILGRPGARSSKINVGVLLSLPAALFLRLGGVFGLMESVLFLAYWASSYVVAEWMQIQRPILLNRAALLPVIAAILYFAATVYASFALPRKLVLLVVGALVNAPLILW